MSRWKYSHPEGVHGGMNYTDWRRWTLARYVQCLHDADLLNKCLEEAHREAQGQTCESLVGEKWTLRFHGLQVLKESPKGGPDAE